MGQRMPPTPNHRRSPSVTRHRRESFWQITAPMVGILLVLGAAFGLIVLSGAVGVSGVANVALIVVGLPLLVLGLVAVAVIVALVLGMGWLSQHTPSYTRVVQDYAARAAGIVERVMGWVANAFISAVMGFSMVQSLLGGDKADDNGSQTD